MKITRLIGIFLSGAIAAHASDAASLWEEFLDATARAPHREHLRDISPQELKNLFGVHIDEGRQRRAAFQNQKMQARQKLAQKHVKKPGKGLGAGQRTIVR
ncbi:MAG: hypothetical protein C0514_04680 [Candidatus Puniceispirillum sp.]|nr:hypothetical protein [Candidatus Puniceispirillum sp.]